MLVLCRIALQSLGGDSGTFKILSGIDRVWDLQIFRSSLALSLSQFGPSQCCSLNPSLSLSLGNRPGHRTLQLELPLHHH